MHRDLITKSPKQRRRAVRNRRRQHSVKPSTWPAMLKGSAPLEVWASDLVGAEPQLCSGPTPHLKTGIAWLDTREAMSEKAGKSEQLPWPYWTYTYRKKTNTEQKIFRLFRLQLWEKNKHWRDVQNKELGVQGWDGSTSCIRYVCMPCTTESYI